MSRALLRKSKPNTTYRSLRLIKVNDNIKKGDVVHIQSTYFNYTGKATIVDFSRGLIHAIIEGPYGTIRMTVDHALPFYSSEIKGIYT